MSDGMRRLVLVLRERAAELANLANDARSLSTQWTSKDVEDFLLHRADVIKSEVEILQRQIQRLLKQS
jgi:ATP-dependent helicase/DNAse subunit B